MTYYQTIPHFLAYFGVAVFLAVVFLAAYVAMTPNRSWHLKGRASHVRQGSFFL